MGSLTRITTALALLAGLALAAGPAAAVEKLSAEAAFEKSQAAVGNRVGAHRLVDMNGDPLALADLLDRPLVISLVYTSCGTVCPIVTDYLREAVLEARGLLGEDSFNVLSFGFDASGDTPAQLRGFASVHRIDGIDRWWVASADPATTSVLLRELGFSYADVAGAFQHITQTTIVTPEGRVYRQVYGEAFPIPMLIEPLKDLVLGRSVASLAPVDLWKRVSFLCTTYNPATGAYRFDYSIFFGIFFSVLSILATAIVIFRLWRERRKALAEAAARGRRVPLGDTAR